jgi:lipoprotein-anchoring transpeptidase ErfK/SrfK
MGLSAPGVGIHGTPVPGSIGYSLSHGCIRMLIPSAEWLFDHVRVGTTVYIVAT